MSMHRFSPHRMCIPLVFFLNWSARRKKTWFPRHQDEAMVTPPWRPLTGVPKEFCLLRMSPSCLDSEFRTPKIHLESVSFPLRIILVHPPLFECSLPSLYRSRDTTCYLIYSPFCFVRSESFLSAFPGSEKKSLMIQKQLETQKRDLLFCENRLSPFSRPLDGMKRKSLLLRSPKASRFLQKLEAS